MDLLSFFLFEKWKSILFIFLFEDGRLVSIWARATSRAPMMIERKDYCTKNYKSCS